MPVRCACQRKPGVLFVTRCGRLLQRFGENKVGKIVMGVLGMTLLACLVYSAATEERQYAAYTPSTGLAERQVKQALRDQLRKYKPHTDHELFARAYGYVRPYY